MLVLTRRIGEGLVLYHKDSGDLIGRIVVARSDESKARIGFDLPPEIRIAREELVEIDHQEAMGGGCSAQPASITNGSLRGA